MARVADVLRVTIDSPVDVDDGSSSVDADEPDV